MLKSHPTCVFLLNFKMSTASANMNIDKFDPESENIDEFMERFKIQCADVLEGAGEDDKKKAGLLIKNLPVSIITDLQRRIKPKKLSEVSYQDVQDKLTSQFETKKSVIGATVNFLNRKQSADESIENYAKALNVLGAGCEYQDCCRDRLLRDSFIAGLKTRSIVSGLITDCETNKKKTFNDVVEKAKLLNQISHDLQDIRNEPSSKYLHVNKVNNSKNVPEERVPYNYVCIRCGTKSKHLARNCFALDKTCTKCNIKGHLAKVCKTKHKKTNKVSEGDDERGEVEDMVGSIRKSRDASASSDNFENFLW